MSCSCYSGLSYDECCRPYHEGRAAPTALALMRSRYSAYAMGKADYIMRTTHRAYRKQERVWRGQINLFCQETHFLGLEILETTEGAKESFITFKALLKKGDEDISFTEKSRFLKERGNWYYCHSSPSSS